MVLDSASTQPLRDLIEATNNLLDRENLTEFYFQVNSICTTLRKYDELLTEKVKIQMIESIREYKIVNELTFLLSSAKPHIFKELIDLDYSKLSEPKVNLIKSVKEFNLQAVHQFDYNLLNDVYNRNESKEVTSW